jgi:hypothetical protein
MATNLGDCVLPSKDLSGSVRDFEIVLKSVRSGACILGEERLVSHFHQASSHHNHIIPMED